MNEDEKKLEEFSKLTQIIKLRNNDREPVKIIINNKKNRLSVLEKNENFQLLIDELKEVVKNIKDEDREVMKKSNFINNLISMLFLAFTSDKNFKEFEINNDQIENIFNTNIFLNSNKVYKNINFYYNDKLYLYNSNKYYNNRYIINFISFLLIFKYLEKGGNIIIALQWFLSKFVDLLYLATLMFEEVYIIERGIAVCKNFKKNVDIINLLLDILKNNYHFELENKKDEKNVISILKKSFIYDLYFKKQLVYNKKKKLYITYMYINYIKYLNNFPFEEFEINKYKKVLKNTLNIESNLVNLNKNKNNNLIFDIFNNDYKILLNLIKNNNLKKCLEVGFTVNYLYELIKDVPDLNLISINTKKFNNYNFLNKNIINNKRFTLINNNCLDVFNTFYNKKENFDFIFLNDKYNFDFVLFYFIYSDKILNINGLIIINNSHLNSVSYCIKYIESNIKNYKKIGNYSTMAVFKKIKNEDRNSHFFIPF